MKTFIVAGTAFVTVKCQAVVEADSREDALRSALRQFHNDPRSLVVPGTVDEHHPFEWAPFVEEAPNAAEDVNPYEKEDH